MSATLSLNQVVEEPGTTGGEDIGTSGNYISHQFRCTPNSQWDPRNSVFVADCTVATYTQDGKYLTETGVQDNWDGNVRYIPGAFDFRAIPALRWFSSFNITVDGQYVVGTNNPYHDAIIVEKYLTTHSMANKNNFQQLLFMQRIDDGVPDHNIFMFDGLRSNQTCATANDWAEFAYNWTKPKTYTSKNTTTTGEGNFYDIDDLDGTNSSTGGLPNSKGLNNMISPNCVSFYYKPPFDLTNQPQTHPGGNVTIDQQMYPAESGTFWGAMSTTPCVGLEHKAKLLVDLPRFRPRVGITGTIECVEGGAFGPQGSIPVVLSNVNANVPALASNKINTAAAGTAGYIDTSFLVPTLRAGRDSIGITSTSANPAVSQDDPLYPIKLAAALMDGVALYPNRIRYMRRTIRPSEEVKLTKMEYDYTNVATLHATASNNGINETFTLPSSTFAILFKIRDTNNKYFDDITDHPAITAYPSDAGSNTSLTDDYATALRATQPNSAATDARTVACADMLSQTMYYVSNAIVTMNHLQFTFASQTIPTYRISNINGGRSSTEYEKPFNATRWIMHNYLIQGVMGTAMTDYPHNLGHGYGKGVIDRITPLQQLFPIVRTGTADNGTLSVEWDYKATKPSSTDPTVADDSYRVQVVISCLYDAQLVYTFSEDNKLTQVTVTEWR